MRYTLKRTCFRTGLSLPKKSNFPHKAPLSKGDVINLSRSKSFLVQQFLENAARVQGQRPWSLSAGSPSLGESAERISVGVRAESETPCAVLPAHGERGEKCDSIFQGDSPQCGEMSAKLTKGTAPWAANKTASPCSNTPVSFS